MEQDAYKLFSESLRYHGSGDLDSSFHDVEELLGNWSEICEKLSEEVETDRENYWIREKQTWDLLRIVLNVDRGRMMGDHVSKTKETVEYMTPTALVADGMQSTEERSRLLALMSWLEMNPSTLPICEKREDYESRTRAVLNKKYKGINDSNDTSGLLVDRLDPDAPLREAPKQLESTDELYESAFIQALFWLVRAGQLEVAIEWCRETNHAWRAASLSGGRLWDQPTGLSSIDDVKIDKALNEGTSVTFANDRTDYDNTQIGNPQEQAKTPVGNLNRDLWKVACRALSENDAATPFERALYGALSGNVESILPVCVDWSDYVWANVVGIIEKCTSNMLGSYKGSNFWVNQEDDSTYPPSEERIFDQLTQLFSTLRRSEHMHIAKEAHDPYRTAQASISVDAINVYLGEYKDLLDMGRLARTTSDLAHILRFLVHLLLAYRLIGVRIDYDVSNALIQAYVKVLEAQGESSDTIAFYASLLDSHDATQAYATHLATLPMDASREMRASSLLACRSHGLDIVQVANATVDLTTQIWVPSASFVLSPKAVLSKPWSSLLQPNLFSAKSGKPDEPILFHDPFAPLDDASKGLIKTVDWLTIDPSTYTEALNRVNNLTRLFLCSGNLAGATALRHNLPSAFVKSISVDSATSGEGHYSSQVEYADMAMFFSAIDAYSSLSQVLPSLLSPSSTQSTALEQLVDNLFKLTLNVLTSSWLLYTDTPSSSSNPLREELDRIRTMYIPELVFRLIYVLVEGSKVQTSIANNVFLLTNTLAKDQYAITPEFLTLTNETSTNYLALYLTMVRDASIAQVQSSGHFVC